MHVLHHCPNALKKHFKGTAANFPNPGAADFNLISSTTWSNSLSAAGLQCWEGEVTPGDELQSRAAHTPLLSHSTTPRRAWAEQFWGWFLLGKNKAPPKTKRTFSSELCKYQLPALIYTVALLGHGASAIFVPLGGDRHKKSWVYERKFCFLSFIHLLADRGNC